MIDFPFNPGTTDWINSLTFTVPNGSRLGLGTGGLALPARSNLSAIAFRWFSVMAHMIWASNAES